MAVVAVSRADAMLVATNHGQDGLLGLGRDEPLRLGRAVA